MDPNWERANIQLAASYLREVLAKAADPRAKVAYEALLDVLDPARRAARLQRERAAIDASAPVQAARERRAVGERRAANRRQQDLGSPTGVERRRAERRSGRDRRSEPR